MNENPSVLEDFASAWAPSARVSIARSRLLLLRGLAYSLAGLIAAFLLSPLMLGLPLQLGAAPLLLLFSAAAGLMFVAQQKHSGRWTFDGRTLRYTSFLVIEDYDILDFANLSAIGHPGPLVAALSLSSQHKYGENLTFSVKEWGKRPLCTLVAAMLRANPEIGISTRLAEVIFNWAGQPLSKAQAKPSWLSLADI